MIINRHNYEEYFILYMDNELSVEDRRQVEEFVSGYPDLKEELDQLMQFKLYPDTSLEFPGKEELWKGSTLIHSGNQTEWLLLYLDGELSSAEKALVEDHLREEPKAREEWANLQKTKLVSEPILFENKEILYRKEEKQRRVIPVFFFRIAAAVILAAIGLTVFFIFNGRGNSSIKPGSGSLADNKKEKSVNDRSPEIKTQVTIPDSDPMVKNEKPEIQKEKESSLAADYRQEKIIDKKFREDKPLADGKEAIAIEKNKEKKITNDLPLPINNPRVIQDEKALAYVKPEEEIHTKEKINTITEVTNPVLPPSDIKTAVYNPNEELEDENGSGKKNRHRGIFRTIARTFEKRTKVDPTEDDKLLVAGFRINLK